MIVAERRAGEAFCHSDRKITDALCNTQCPTNVSLRLSHSYPTTLDGSCCSYPNQERRAWGTVPITCCQCTAHPRWGQPAKSSTLAPWSTTLTHHARTQRATAIYIYTSHLALLIRALILRHWIQTRGRREGSAGDQQHLPWWLTVWARFPGTAWWMERSNFYKLLPDLHTCTEMCVRANMQTHTQ